MKDDRRIANLYAGLTGKETATLVFSHLAAGNVAEADRIRDLVPMKVYRLPDPEHVDHFERLQRATLYYGMERWRYEARCHAAVAVVIDCYHRPDEEDEHGPECFDLWQMWETRLLSLDAALEASCGKHNIDVAAVRHFVDADGPYQVRGLGEVDPQLVAEMTLTFDGVFRENR